MPDGEQQGVLITACQMFGFVDAAAIPDRADRVDDMAVRKIVGAGDPCFAGGASAERAAFGEQARTRRTMDRTIDASAAQQK